MAKRLSDAELAQRTRAGNRRRSEHHRQRLESAGHVQLVVWTPIEVKTALESLATTTNQSLSATATAVLSAALTTTTPNQTTTTPRASNDATVDMFGATGEPSAPAIPQAERDQQILELHRQGLSNYAVADKAGCSEATVRRTLKRYNPESSHD
jgi:DNA-binding NarL/FixJ family response regulator